MSTTQMTDEILQLISELNDTHSAYSIDPEAPAMTALSDWLENRFSLTAFLHPCLSLFIGADNADLLTMIQNGSHPLCQLCEKFSFDFRVYDMGDNTQDQNDRALAYGMMAVDEAMDLLVITDAQTDETDFPATSTLDAFLSKASAQSAATLGAIIAAIQAGIPIIYEGAATENCVRFLNNLAPNLLGYALPAKAIKLGADTNAATGILSLQTAILAQTITLSSHRSEPEEIAQQQITAAS